MTALRVSVVVPTCRRPPLLERCLRALLAQRFDPAAFEIVVVDDGHDEATRATVERLGRGLATGPQLRYLRPPSGRGPAVARNAGWRHAEAAVIAFTDDDTTADADWLAEGLAALERHGAAAATGRVRVPRPPVRPTDHTRMTIGLETAEFVTANAFVRRSALEAVGGFDERFRRAWREDTDLQFALLERGFVIVPAPTAIVDHPVRPEAWGVSLRQQRNAFYEALLYKKHRRLYLSRVRPGRPLDFYAIVLGGAATAAALAAGRPTVAAGAGAVVVMLIGAFVARRLRGADRSPAHVAEMLLTSVAIPFLSVYWRLRGALHFRVLYW